MDALKKKKEKRKKIKKKDLEKEDQNVNEERERDKQHESSIRGKKNESNFIREFHSFLLPPPYPLRPNFLALSNSSVVSFLFVAPCSIPRIVLAYKPTNLANLHQLARDRFHRWLYAPTPGK